MSRSSEPTARHPSPQRRKSRHGRAAGRPLAGKPATAKGPRSYHHGDLRRSLVAAALNLLGRHGLDGLTLRAVAREAGVSHAAPYHHFASRDELIEALAATGFGELRAFVVRHLETTRYEPAAMLQEAAVGYVLFAVEHPDLYRLMFGGALQGRNPTDALLAASASAYDLIHTGITAAFAGRAADPERVALLARTCWAISHGVATLTIDGQLGPADREEVATLTRAITQVLWQGMRSG
jgi:AcrR family transcriptional regulator